MLEGPSLPASSPYRERALARDRRDRSRVRASAASVASRAQPFQSGELPPRAQPPAPSPISCNGVWMGPTGVGVAGVGAGPLGSPVTAAGALSSASAVPPNAPRLIRAPFGVGSSPTASAGS